MENIKNALTRKFGPLPAWAWFAIAFVVIMWWRNRSGSATSTTTTTDTSTPSGQSPVDIPPGDSVYDPSTGALLTAPGGGSTGSDGSGNPIDTGGGLGSGVGTISPSDVNLGPLTSVLNSIRRTDSAILKKLNAKPAHKTAKPKKVTKPGTKTTKPPKGKGRARSTTAIKNKTHAPKPSAVKPKGVSRSVKGPSHSMVRTHPKTRMTTTTVRQRPVAATQPAHTSGASTQLRPSNPQPAAKPRIQTAPKPAPKPKPRKK